MPNVNSIEAFTDTLFDVMERPEFFALKSFDPNYMAELMYNGFLPMALELPTGSIFLTPKLHYERCLLYFDKLHIPKSLKKKSKQFSITFDMAVDKVFEGCLEQHEESWLYKPLRDALLKLFQNTKQKVSFHSIELWLDKKLVAGEIGYTVGSCYTSLSGFYTINSSGTIQMVGAALLLKKLGFSFWDLGMYMSYKENLGAELVPGQSFVRSLRKIRDNKAPIFPKNEIFVRELLV
ncbi:MAG: hypothetical protein KDK90_06970 [Leptospiraceae bacterium]|nr:hypothetical protein [Leptospiraceae bacterium]